MKLKEPWEHAQKNIYLVELELKLQSMHIVQEAHNNDLLDPYGKECDLSEGLEEDQIALMELKSLPAYLLVTC